MAPEFGAIRRPDAARTCLRATPTMEFVSLELSAGIARVTLTRSARRNAINAQMAAEFAQVALSLEEQGITVAVLDAEGPAFCAGADLGELGTAGAAVDSIVKSLLSVPIHWTAAVAGAARGAALSVLAACPRVFATPNASFGLPELAKGFFPAEVINSQVAVIGARRAYELAFRAQAIDATEAMSIGLISEIIALDELENRLDAETTTLASADPEEIRVGVRLWQAHAREGERRSFRT